MARRLVLHEDDLGMCHGANAAFVELSGLGVCTSGSVMVPCPWFLEIAEIQAARPALDIGVHLTLNAEKKHYRWRPLTKATKASGLVDDDGFFWRSVPEVRRNARPEAVEAELRAQIDAALAAGVDSTHLDGHMGAVVSPEFVDIYVRLGRDYRLPILLTRTIESYDPRGNLGDTGDGRALTAAAEAAVAYGSPLFDLVLETPWTRGPSIEADYRERFDRIGPGLTFFALHFNAPGEVEAIEPDSAHIRTGELVLFRSDGFRRWLAEQDYELIGLRGFRDRLRNGAGGPA